MVPLNKFADRLLRLFLPEVEASANMCMHWVCEKFHMYCCTERGCYIVPDTYHYCGG